MKRGRPDPRRAKIHRSYTVADIARLYGVHRNTVWHWLKSGLRSIEGIWPALILGAELRRFLTDKRSRRKRPTPPGHIYCLPCREHQRPAGNMVDYVAHSPTGGNLKGICPTCEAILNRCVRRSDLASVTAGLDVKITAADETLGQTSQPSVNNDSSTPNTPHAETQP